MARLEIGWENKGEKAAGATTMGVLVPGSIPEFRWTDKWRGAIRFWTGSDFAAAPATRRGRDAGSVGEHRDTVREATTPGPPLGFVED
jgi:hypothetical protein